MPICGGMSGPRPCWACPPSLDPPSFPSPSFPDEPSCPAPPSLRPPCMASGPRMPGGVMKGGGIPPIHGALGMPAGLLNGWFGFVWLLPALLSDSTTWMLACMVFRRRS
eukprot:767032-Hanusia_phi.AAC.2